MNCPVCNANIEEFSKICKDCGQAFPEEILSQMTFFREVKQDIQKLELLKNNLNGDLDNLSLKLTRREDALQQELRAKIQKAAEPPVSTPFVAPSMPPSVPPAMAPAQPEQLSVSPQAANVQPSKQPASARPTRPVISNDGNDFELKLGQRWLLIVGIVTMVFGVGYFLKYSFDQGWVGPAGRVASAYFWGVALLLAGDRFRKKDFEVFGLYLVGGGIAVLYFSTFAGFQIYDLFSQTLSFSIMVLVTALAVTLSVIYDTKWLAVLGLIGGFLTPVLLGTNQDNELALMTYMTILNLGLLGIAYYKQWNILNVLGFFATLFLFSAWHTTHYDVSKFWLTLYFINEFYLLYTFIPLFYLISAHKRQKAEKTDIETTDPTLFILVLNSFIAFAINFTMIRDKFSTEWVGVYTLSCTAIFLLIATYLKKKERAGESPFFLFAGKAALYLVLSVPIIFSMHWITLFWSVESAFLIWFGLRVKKELAVQCGYVLLGVTIMKFLFRDYPQVFRLNLDEIFFVDSYTFMMIPRLLTTLVLLGSIFTARQSLKLYAPRGPVRDGEKEFKEVQVANGVFGFLVFLCSNVEVLAFFHDYLPSARFAAVSVLWTLFAVGLMVLGFRYKDQMLRKISFGLFFVTLLKVFLFDIASFSTPYRIISFIILGMVLVTTSYLYYRFKNRIFPSAPEKEPAREEK